jgi:hypothetical protein
MSKRDPKQVIKRLHIARSMNFEAQGTELNVDRSSTAMQRPGHIIACDRSFNEPNFADEWPVSIRRLSRIDSLAFGDLCAPIVVALRREAVTLDEGCDGEPACAERCEHRFRVGFGPA